MSNIYIQEPPALGKVLLKTTAGDIDVELWTKEAPKACRNFIQLCMEHYYNGTIFHRVVPGFIVQGGDPNGDGTGGESIYGEPFKDEFHSRLRFNRRGLVAMANAGKDDNGSQFFFTLAATPELQNKHTIFGKVTGETIYNVLKLAEGLIGADDRPEHPHKITGTEVLINPFTDIEIRSVEVKVEEVSKKKKKERQAVKNFGLLSFGEEAEEDEDEALEFRGKPKSTHDLLEDPKLSKKTAAELEQEEQNIKENESSEDVQRREETVKTVNSIRDKLKSKTREKSPDIESKKRKEESGGESGSEEEYYLGKERDIERQKRRNEIRNEIKQLRKEMKDAKDDKKEEESSTEEQKGSKSLEEDNEMYKKFIEEQEKYRKMKEKIPKKGAARINPLNAKERLRRPKQATASQITALVDYMCDHKELSSGKIEPPYDRATYEEEWLTLANNLNAMGGAFKSVDKWKQTWRDVKSNAKKRGFHSRRGSGSKGDNYTEKSERSVEKKIFDFVDPLAVQDLENMDENAEQTEVDDVLHTYPVEEMSQEKTPPHTVRLKKRKRSFDYSWNSILEIEREKLKLQKEEMEYKLKKLAVLDRLATAVEKLAKKK